jgi:hypothetical protein
LRFGSGKLRFLAVVPFVERQVSHDQHFISSTASELWVVDGARKAVHRTQGGFREYKESLLKSLGGGGSAHAL